MSSIIQILGAYERYKQHKADQYRDNGKMAKALQDQFNEEYKALPDDIQMKTMPALAVVNTIPESFADFMVWLRRDAQVNGLIPLDSEPEQATAKKPKQQGLGGKG